MIHTRIYRIIDKDLDIRTNLLLAAYVSYYDGFDVDQPRNSKVRIGSWTFINWLPYLGTCG